MFATLEGAEALDLRLSALPAVLRARLEGKARERAAALAAKVRDEKLSGQSLATRSGALKASISEQVAVNGDLLTAAVGSNGDVKYAAIQEFGGRTAAHEIVAQKGQALAFLAGGGIRFAHRVEHPGSTLPARAYLRSSLEEARDEIVDAFAATAKEAWDNP
jgi:phage gpG-like protein